MFKQTNLSVAVAALFCLPVAAHAASDPDLQAIREQIQQLKQNYEQRISQLEARLQKAESTSSQAQSIASAAQTSVQQIAQQPVASTGSAGAFNPAVSFILSGTYGNLTQSPTIPATGFAMSANNTGYSQGFSLKESELGISANIDPDFRGVATMSLAPTGGVTVENGFVQTSILGNGLNMKMGRFFSALGYLNEQHAHTWDFVDQPLVYRTLWDNQLAEDGLQLKWLAPTDMFVEVGGEVGRGLGFPGTNRAKNGIGSGVLFAHIGDDIGIENSWRAGMSLQQTRRVNAISPDAVNPLLNNSFNGDSQTAGLDFIWKYSPNGNTANRYVKLQGEYFQRKEIGLLTYDTALTNVTGSLASRQSGWYLQSVYQFMPHWRTGLRYDQLDPGTSTVGAPIAGFIASSYGYQPHRTSLMLDYSPSEFSRLRLQLARDNSRQGLQNNQIFVQYIMSMGAHGAHQY